MRSSSLIVLLGLVSLTLASQWTRQQAKTIPRWGNPTSPSELIQADYLSYADRLMKIETHHRETPQAIRPSSAALSAMEYKLKAAQEGSLPIWNEEIHSWQPVDNSHLGPSGSSSPSYIPPLDSNRVRNNVRTTSVRAPADASLNAPGAQEAQLGAGWAGPNATIFTPPDPAVAVGPNSVIAMTNLIFSLYDKSTGAELASTQACAFWGETPTSSSSCSPGIIDAFDPRAVYDVYLDRFILIIMDGTSSARSYIQVAVSNDDSPATLTSSDWTIIKDLIDGGETNSLGVSLWADYPSLGLDRDNVYVTVNLFEDSGIFSHSSVYAWKKSDMLSPPASNFPYTTFAEVTTPSESLFATPSNAGTLTSSVMFGDPGTGVFATFGSLSTGWSGVYTPTIHVYRLDDAEDLTKAELIGKTLDVAPFPTVEVNTMDQTDGYTGLDALGSTRMLDAKYIDGTVWMTHIVTNDDADLNIGRWYAIDMCHVEVASSGNIELEDAHVGFPALALGPNGVAVVTSGSGPSLHPSMWISHRFHTDPPGTMRPPQRIQSDWDFPFENVAGGFNRWGDYYAGAVDPSDLNTLWLYGEIPSTSVGSWSTFVQEINMCPGCDPVPSCGDCEDSPIVDGPNLLTCPASALTTSLWTLALSLLMSAFLLL